jgi:hypothetical protein
MQWRGVRRKEPTEKKATEREEREHGDKDTITERGADAGWHKQRKRLVGVKEGGAKKSIGRTETWFYPCYCV